MNMSSQAAHEDKCMSKAIAREWERENNVMVTTIKNEKKTKKNQSHRWKKEPLQMVHGVLV